MSEGTKVFNPVDAFAELHKEFTELKKEHSELKEQFADMIIVQKGLNEANKGMLNFINGIPTNKELLYVLMKNMLSVYEANQATMANAGAFQYKIEWFDTPAPGSLGVEVRAHAEGPNSIHITQKQKDGQWDELANTDETGPFHTWLGERMLAAGYTAGMLKYALLTDITVQKTETTH